MPDSRAGRASEMNPRRLWIALAGYIALLVVLSLHHEMWRDEVRALSVATSGSLGQMFASLHHEGHPSLWYIILRISHSIAGSSVVLPVMAIAIAAITAWLILRFAPFPPWLRILSIFGVFLGYEMSVLARNYGMGVLFLVLSCIAYASRERRAVLLGFSIALLANTSVHAAIGAIILILLWLADLVDEETRPALKSPAGAAGILIGSVGVIASILSAMPTTDMAWAVPLSSLDIGTVVRAVLTDPGKSLLGFANSNIAALEQFPWQRIGIEDRLASRVIVDACIAWLLWSVRESRRAIAAIVLAILGFAFLFRIAYTASPRHEGLLLFLILAICWFVVVRRKVDPAMSRRFALGLLPLFALQSLALPIVIQRNIRLPESSSKAYAAFIESDPRYRNAILMAEPDYMMESMPYYVKNPVFMPRQREFSKVVYFDKGTRRKQSLSLTELMSIADSVACARKQPVLLAIEYDDLIWGKGGVDHPNYKGATFTWTDAERSLLLSRQPDHRPIARFEATTSDEFYTVYLLDCPR